MKRPESHGIDTRGQRIFEACLPPEWVVRDQHPDYGVDYEVEVFEKGSSTGILFKVQLKSTVRPDLSSDGTFISCEIETGRADYLCEKLLAPAALVVADVEAGTVYWATPQLDEELVRRVREAAAVAQKSVTVRVPTANQLPHTLAPLLNAIADAQILLGTRVVQTSTVPHFVSIAGQHLDSDDLIGDLSTKVAALKVRQILSAYDRGSPEDAWALLDEVLRTPDADRSVKITAIIQVERHEQGRLTFPPATAHQAAKITLWAASQMRFVAADGPLVHRLHAAISFRAAQLELLACDGLGMYQNWVANQAGGDPFWRLSLAYARRHNADRLLRKYRECVRLVNFALRRQQYTIVPDCAERVILATLSLIQTLDNEGFAEQANAHRVTLLELGGIGVDIAAHEERWYVVGGLANQTLLAAFRVQDEADRARGMEWAEHQLSRIPLEDLRCEWMDIARRGVERATAALGLQSMTSDEHSALDRQIYQNMAISLGINLDDPKDEVAGVVRLGIADLNPERVLKPCRHLFVKLGSHGLVGEWLRLPTAGSKVLLCTRHGHGVEALSLDACLDGMMNDPCSECPDKAPHDGEWRWTPEWQQEQNRLHGHIDEGSHE